MADPKPKKPLPRWEILFRLGFGLVGLALIGVAVAVRGIPQGPALFEVFGIAGLFFGGTVVWAILKLRAAKSTSE